MKHILKYLTIAGVLILFLPFFRMCVDSKPAQKVTESIDTIVQVDTVNISSNATVNENTREIEQKKINIPILKTLNPIKSIFDVQGATSGFQLGITLPLIIIDSVKEHNKINEIDKAFFSFLFFFLILINSFLLILFSFLKKINILWILASINIVLLIISYILLVTDIDQIKYGSYLFLINSLLIIYFSIKHKKLIKI